MTNIHDQVNLRPQDYEVVAYLDNNPFADAVPKIVTPEMRKAWEDEMAFVLGADWKQTGIAWRCKHCGNGCVRYIAACQHAPTGEVVVFGSSCVERLGFKDEKQFQLARIKSRAEAEKVRLKAYLDREETLKNNPELAAAVADTAHHNTFVQDVVRKLNTYGTLSERQAAAVIAAVARAKVAAAAPKPADPTEDAPDGTATITGKIVYTKVQGGEYPGDYVAHKCLILLPSGCKVWGTLPAKAAKGETITMTANFKRKDGERFFSFYSRPRKVIVLKGAE